MRNSGIAPFLLALVAAIALALPTRATVQDGIPNPQDQFVMVNGLKLHYVDWGGQGEPPLVLLTPGGGSVRYFDPFATKFTDRFHVLGFTRRGQGLSEKPPSGYDTDTLAEDIRGFLDAMGLQRVNLAAYSIGGPEMTRFAVKYPHRVAKLIYLDAASDYKELDQLAAEAHYSPPTDPYMMAISRGASATDPPFAKVTQRALAFFVLIDAPIPLGPQPTADDGATRRFFDLLYESDFQGKQIKRFRREMKHAKVVLLHHTLHGSFLREPASLSIVIPQMRQFLLTK